MRGEFYDKIAKTVEYLTLHDVEEVGKILDELETNEGIYEEVGILQKKGKQVQFTGNFACGVDAKQR